MKPMMKKTLFLLALLLVSSGLPAGAAIDPFYQGLLRDGTYAYDRKDFAKAVRDLRLACFGMLDEPKRLADCLARLALAQDRAEDLEGFRESFRRLVEIEERFTAYSQGDLTPELKAALGPRLAARIPAATLQGVPAFRGLAKAEAPAPAGGGKPRGGKAEPPPPVSVPVQAPVQAPPAAAQPPEASREEREKMEQARKLLAEQTAMRELRPAFQMAREVADAKPALREAQHLAAEAAYRLSRWDDAATYFRRGGDPGEDQPELLFYLAVSLYESGDAAGAATILKRSLPNLRPTDYVKEYQRKILGQ
jgi:hypothetical protein